MRIDERRSWAAVLAAVAFSLAVGDASSAVAAEDDLSAALAAVAAVGKEGAGQVAAVEAVETLNAAGPEAIPAMLRAMPKGNPLAENWIRGAIEHAAAKADRDSKALPLAEIEAFVVDRAGNPRARRLAFEVLVTADSTRREALLAEMTEDPSLELRREALELAVGRADAALAAERKDEAIGLYREAIIDARDVDQIQMLAGKLKDLGETVRLADLFGFVMEWNAAGPFDNVGEQGFAIAYGPEIEATRNEGGAVDATAEYDGKHGKVRWSKVTTEDEYGKVDLNVPYAKEKGACVYAYAEFISPVERTAELRVGSINANKAWINGEEVLSNEVYHAATSVDQYAAPIRLKAGKNAILLKICQNEQTEAWAQDFEFQCRVCDETGTAIHSQDRPRPDAAGLPTDDAVASSR